jgi:hypothetical protein
MAQKLVKAVDAGNMECWRKQSPRFKAAPTVPSESTQTKRLWRLKMIVNSVRQEDGMTCQAHQEIRSAFVVILEGTMSLMERIQVVNVLHVKRADSQIKLAQTESKCVCHVPWALPKKMRENHSVFHVTQVYTPIIQTWLTASYATRTHTLTMQDR